MNLNELNTRDNPKFQDMKLLDWFAGQAMQAQMSKQEVPGDNKIAAWSYDMAEAMLEERRRRMNADAPTR